jgi:hypothetical protein
MAGYSQALVRADERRVSSMPPQPADLVRFGDLDTDWGRSYAAELREMTEMFDEYTRRSKESGGQGRALRQAHAKTYGLVRASLDVHGDLPAPYAQGVYAEPASYDAVVRFSNGLPHVRPDARLGNACGVGIKLFGVPGASLLDDEPDTGTMDYNLINNATFFCNTVHDYLVIAPLFDQLPDPFYRPDTRHAYLHDFLTRAGSLPPEKWLWDELLSLLSFSAVARINLLLHRYWSMGAVRHGEYVAKVRVAPTPASAATVANRTVDVLAEPEPYRRTLVADVAAADHVFDLQIQLCTGLDAMPVENTSLEWPERLSPFVTVATLTIPAQDISADANLAAAEHLSFTPWRTREAHRPLGQIQDVRREVYRRVSTVRHEVNGAPRREPASIDEVFAATGPTP